MKSLLLWDFADERSWLHPTREQLGPIPPGTYSFPTPFSEPSIGEPLERKTAYLGFVDAFADHVDQPFFRSGDRRLQGVGGEAANYLGRAGTGLNNATAGSSTWLGQLTAERENWTSLQWDVEPAGDGLFRIRSLWNGSDGYLTREGLPNNNGGFDPTVQLSL